VATTPPEGVKDNEDDPTKLELLVDISKYPYLTESPILLVSPEPLTEID
jgi:hypothetical protein